MSTTAKTDFGEFIKIVQKLRDPKDGCPWDLKQTHNSLKQYLIEECYEVIQAIEENDDEELVSELGDVLLQVVLHAQVAKDRNTFNIHDVIQSISDKMIRRHPHVFGDSKVNDVNEVLKNWEEIKILEKANLASKDAEPSKTPITEMLNSIPSALPALHRAERIGDKAAQVNFDWRSINDVWRKVNEELGEVEAELKKRQNTQTASEDLCSSLEHEIGDLLFAVCQLARWLNISAENALGSCCKRFIRRIETMENTSSHKLSELDTSQLEQLWQKAKSLAE